MSFLSSPRRFVPLAFVGAIAMTMLQGAAFAADVPARQTAIVRYGDLNLNNPLHVAELDRRIFKAAKKACAAQNWRDLKSMTEAPGCRDTAIADARGKRDVAVAAAQSSQRLAAQLDGARGTTN